MASAIKSRIFSEFVELGIIDEGQTTVFQKGVRDNPNINMLQCGRSGVLFASCDYDSAAHYENYELNEFDTDVSNSISVLADGHVSNVNLPKPLDLERRTKFLRPLVQDKVWLDFGAGRGEIIEVLQDATEHAMAVEINPEKCALMAQKGISISGAISNVQSNTIDIVTAFHSFEHVMEPFRFLRQFKRVLRPGGCFVAEVRHSGDALLHSYECEAYRSFAFFSELPLFHSETSLRELSTLVGFASIEIHRVQRYGLANHLYWLAKGEPGGHERWHHLSSTPMDIAYEQLLAERNETDCLVAVFKA